MKTIIISGIVLFLIIIVFNNIYLINPKNNEETTETDILFRWIGNEEYELYLDNNKDFTSPTITETDNNLVLIRNLSIDEYYWFVKSENKKSLVRKFTIISLVSINRSFENNSLRIRNTGNVDLNVSSIIGFTILPLEKTIVLGSENIIIRQK